MPKHKWRPVKGNPAKSVKHGISFLLINALEIFIIIIDAVYFISRLLTHRRRFNSNFSVKLFLLFDKKFFERSFEFWADPWNSVNVGHGRIDQVLVEGRNDKQFLKYETWDLVTKHSKK